jgi:hypothetical protein
VFLDVRERVLMIDSAADARWRSLQVLDVLVRANAPD